VADREFSTTAQFLRGLRIAVVVIAVTVLAFSSIFRNLGRYDPPELQLTAYLVLSSIVVVEIVLVRTGRGWGKLRGPALAVVFLASTAAVASLPPDTAISSVDWAFGTVGWTYLILLLDQPLGWLVGALLLHESVTVVGLLLSGTADVDDWLTLVAGSVGALGFPAAAGIAAVALRSVAQSAESADRQTEALRTAEEVAVRLQEQRESRFAEIRESTIPLLRGLADGGLDPTTATVQRQCAIEAARMRRLFTAADAVPDALMHSLRQCAAVADRRQVAVDLDPSGSWTDPPAAVRRALTDAPVAALATARSFARITVVGAQGTLAVSVVADCGHLDFPADLPPDVTLTSETDGDVLWVEALWTPTVP
jgi:hypothetical protein